MSIEDWNREFGELVRRGGNQPGETASGAIGTGDARAAPADADQAMAARWVSIAATLARLGFIAADRATPDNPAVEVLSELLPPDAELALCLTCHELSCSGPYPFAETTGVFRDVASFFMNPAAGAELSAGGPPLMTVPRRELVVCTQAALGWTSSRVTSDREDTVTLYSVPFRDIVGATVRDKRKGVVVVWVDDGPTLSCRVNRQASGALQAYVDQAAQAQ